MNQICNTLLAPTPPMGWNSWDCFGLDVSEQEVIANAEFMAKYLKEFGWQYVVVDLGWYAPGVSTTNYKQPEIPLLTDQYGRLVPVPERFPSSIDGKGFKPLADHVHSLGLKFGIHIMRGMPWIAAKEKKTIKTTNIPCSDVADPNDMCLWYKSMYGIDCTKDGAQQYYDSLIELYTEWGVDFIKADDMGSWDGDGLNSPYRTDEVEALSKAITKHGNKMVLSLSPGAAYIGNASHLNKHAHMWRISADFWDDWAALKRQFPRCEAWSKRKIEGHWPDADMLPLGRIGIRGEIGQARYTNFTETEQQTLMALWCMFRSPLMYGGDLAQMDDFTLGLLTNKELIEINQTSANNRVAATQNEIVRWDADHQKNDKKQFVALFNLADSVQNAKCSFGNRMPNSYTNVWTGETTTNTADVVEFTIEPHGCILLVLNH